MNEKLEKEKNRIIEEIYLTGRYQRMYMGVISNSKQNPIKVYIKQWLIQKGIKTNLNQLIDEFYQELFVHIGKIKAETLVELSLNNKKLFATICTIIQRQLMKVDVNPIINFLRKFLLKEYSLNEKELEKELENTCIDNVDYKEFKKIIKSKFIKDILPFLNLEKDKDYLFQLLKFNIEIDSNKIKSTNVSTFEKLKHNSNLINQESNLLSQVENKVEDEGLFKAEFGIDLNDIIDELKKNTEYFNNFNRLVNRKLYQKKRSEMTKEEKEKDKKYWDNLETDVLNVINQIKFKLK